MQHKIDFQFKQISQLKQERARQEQNVKKLERRIEEINMKMQGYDKLKMELENQVDIKDGNPILSRYLLIQIINKLNWNWKMPIKKQCY